MTVPNSLARLLAHEEELLALDHAAAIGEWKIAASQDGRQRLIRLAHFAALEQRLVGAPAGYLARKNHHASRLAVEAMDRRQLGAVQAFLQARQQGLLHEAPGRRHGQEVRLVDHHQVFVLEQDLFLERDRRFVFQLAVVKMRMPRRYALSGPSTAPSPLSTSPRAMRSSHCAALICG